MAPIRVLFLITLTSFRIVTTQNGHHDVHARPENTDRTKDKKISYLGGIPVRLVLVGRPRRPTDRRRSSDEHTNKREVELTSISQQTTTEGTPRLLLVLICSRGVGFLSCHWQTELQQTPRPPFCIEVQVSGSKATWLPSCASETTKYNPYGSRILQPLTQNLPSRLSSNFEELLSRSPLGCPVMGLRIGEKLIEY